MDDVAKILYFPVRVTFTSVQFAKGRLPGESTNMMCSAFSLGSLSSFSRIDIVLLIIHGATNGTPAMGCNSALPPCTMIWAWIWRSKDAIAPKIKVKTNREMDLWISAFDIYLKVVSPKFNGKTAWRNNLKNITPLTMLFTLINHVFKGFIIPWYCVAASDSHWS